MRALLCPSVSWSLSLLISSLAAAEQLTLHPARLHFSKESLKLADGEQIGQVGTRIEALKPWVVRQLVILIFFLFSPDVTSASETEPLGRLLGHARACTLAKDYWDLAETYAGHKGDAHDKKVALLQYLEEHPQDWMAIAWLSRLQHPADSLLLRDRLWGAMEDILKTYTHLKGRSILAGFGKEGGGAAGIQERSRHAFTYASGDMRNAEYIAVLFEALTFPKDFDSPYVQCWMLWLLLDAGALNAANSSLSYSVPGRFHDLLPSSVSWLPDRDVSRIPLIEWEFCYSVMVDYVHSMHSVRPDLGLFVATELAWEDRKSAMQRLSSVPGSVGALAGLIRACTQRRTLLDGTMPRRSWLIDADWFSSWLVGLDVTTMQALMQCDIVGMPAWSDCHAWASSVVLRRNEEVIDPQLLAMYKAVIWQHFEEFNRKVLLQTSADGAGQFAVVSGKPLRGYASEAPLFLLALPQDEAVAVLSSLDITDQTKSRFRDRLIEFIERRRERWPDPRELQRFQQWYDPEATPPPQ